MTKNERRSAHINSIAMRYGGFKCCQNDLTKVWRSWRRMECKLHNLLESENSENYERVREESERLEQSLRKRIIELFRNSSKCSGELFFNHDARGYSIKFDVPRGERASEMVCDWGDYVILAPEELL